VLTPLSPDTFACSRCAVPPLALPKVVLGSHHSPLLPLLGSHSSPTNSSQSDTATTADAQLSLGSAGATGDIASRPNSSKQGTSMRAHASTAAAGNTHAGHGCGQRSQHSSHAGGYEAKREWLYRLVTFPHYFTPCVSCCSGSNTPKREQLMTLFDTRHPHQVFCCHCPTPKGSTGHFSASHGRDGALLQVCGLACAARGVLLVACIVCLRFQECALDELLRTAAGRLASHRGRFC
jgi:hypothetical protein